MPKVSKETASQVREFGPVIDRREEMDGYTIEFVSFGADSDLEEPLQALPGGACQCPHWGTSSRGACATSSVTAKRSMRPAMPR
jgi:hypothetical protein